MTAELLTAQDVAARLKVSPRQVFKLASSGRLPKPLKVARSTRWRESDISAWIVNGGKMPEAAGEQR